MQNLAIYPPGNNNHEKTALSNLTIRYEYLFIAVRA